MSPCSNSWLVSWVQNGANVEIHGVDDTCMLSKQELKTLNNAWLDRAHRFLRLWLATGYKVWELDLLLKAPAVGNGQLDQATLVALLAFRQLQDATRLRVDQLLAFYQNIDRNTPRPRRQHDDVPSSIKSFSTRP